MEMASGAWYPNFSPEFLSWARVSRPSPQRPQLGAGLQTPPPSVTEGLLTTTSSLSIQDEPYRSP
jgi:hypothetical protein